MRGYIIDKYTDTPGTDDGEHDWLDRITVKSIEVYKISKTITVMEQECEMVILHAKDVQKIFGVVVPNGFCYNEQGNVILIMDWANFVVWIPYAEDVLEWITSQYEDIGAMEWCTDNDKEEV